MTTFIEIEQDGKKAYVNPQHVALVVAAPLIGQSQIILFGGLTATVKGTVQEVLAKLEGRNILA